MPGEKETLEKIHRIAEQEFLEKGFKGASLRNIVKEAGVTTGAFYGYYSSKEELFDALVKPHADYMINYFIEMQQKFTILSEEEQVNMMSGYSEKSVNIMMDYAYEHLTGIKLLLSASVGTKYENFEHKMVEIEIQSTHNFIKILEQLGRPVHRFHSHFEHTIVSGMFTAFFELLLHDVPYEEAKECANEILKFYQAGWAACLGLK